MGVFPRGLWVIAWPLGSVPLADGEGGVAQSLAVLKLAIAYDAIADYPEAPLYCYVVVEGLLAAGQIVSEKIAGWGLTYLWQISIEPT